MSTQLLQKNTVHQQVPTNFLLENFQNLRIIQPSLIFLHGIPEFLSHPNKLQQQISIYGSTNKITVKKISKDFYSAFINFDEPVYAAMTIIVNITVTKGVNGFQLSNRKIRASFGSTKFCPCFLKNQNCTVRDCNYAHFYEPSLTFYKQYLQDFNHQQFAKNQLNLSKLMIVKTHMKNNFQKKGKNKIFPSGIQILQELEKSNQILSEDEWSELHFEIDSFIEGKSESERQKQRQKTRIQQFLDEAEKTLMQLIFKSAIF